MGVCEDRELLLGGLVDGELDAANTARVEAHVTRCEGCREELERLHAVRNLLGIENVRHSAPDSLLRRIEAIPELSPKPSPSSRLPSWLAPGVAGALAASLGMIMLVQPIGGNPVEEQVVSSHVRSLQPGHLLDVQTTNQHIVKPWFNGKIDFAPPVPELSGQGFPLVGGRLDSVEGKTVAAIVYRRRLHTVNLFVWPGNVLPRSSVQDGFAVAEWSQGGLRFAAVSDLSPDELAQFEQTYRNRAAAAQPRKN